MRLIFGLEQCEKCGWHRGKAVAVNLDGDRGGETYDPALDYERLNAQARRVWDVMECGEWMPLSEIAARTGDPEASISARLRDFRKPRFGGHVVERRRTPRDGGLWLYRLVPRRT